ncbi:MAG: hypothetical protein AAGD92_05610 [Pseudomonadota bacterium]
MFQKRKLWTGISSIAFTAGALTLSACGAEGETEGEGAEGEGAVIASEGEGEGYSEGEGESEGEGAAASGDPADDDAAYLHQLGLIRGHLIAFLELYRAGAYDMALKHVKHPGDEIYADLESALAAREMPGFAGELAALSEAATSRSETMEAAYDDVITAVQGHGPGAGPRETLLAVSKIAETAADEFYIGVDYNGAVIEPHEYQDAYGFLTAVREMLSELSTDDINASEAVAVAHEQLDLALDAFDGLVAETTQGEASAIYGAAARIEIAALGL